MPGDVGVVEVDFSDSKIHVGRHPLRLTLSFLSPGPPRLLCRHTARRATDRPASGRSRMRRRSAACSTCVARLGNGNPPGRWDGELWWRHRCLELAAKLFAIDAGLKGGMVLFSVLSSAVAAPQIKVSLDCRLVRKLDALVGAFWSYMSLKFLCYGVLVSGLRLGREKKIFRCHIGCVGRMLRGVFRY